jgi:hypothetical protein
LGRLGPAQTVEPKSNQQVATNSNHFPTNHKSNNVIGSDQLEHRSCKQALVAQETRQVRVVLHISQTVDMHAKAHQTDCH